MSRHVEFSVAAFRVALSCVMAVFVPLAGAQTIADYSRAQRALLESAMSQAAERSAGAPASAPTLAALPAVAASAPVSRVSRGSMPAPSPAVQVSGIFVSSAGAIAEVVVNATAYLLGVGQGVPGTAWRMETVAIDRVVLGRQAGATANDAEGARKVFPLPALH